jgi:hypothetical protein
MASNPASPELRDPHIDFVILADRAEAVNGKLYVMGGAFDTINVTNIQNPIVFSFAIGFVFPPFAPDGEYQFHLQVDRWPEAGEPVFHASGVIQREPAERDEAAAPGRMLLAHPGNLVRFPDFGIYSVTARLEGWDERRTTFRIAASPPGGAGNKP